MDAEFKEKTGKKVMTFIKKIEKIGGRLPGSPEERRAADMIVEEVRNEMDIEAKKEKFMVYSKATVGGIPIYGVAGYIALIAYIFNGYVAAIIAGLSLLVAGFQVFRYSNVFNFLFKKTESSNVTAEIPARSGKNDFTIIFSAHYDTSWNWTHASGRNDPKYFIIKLATAMLSIILLIIMGCVVGNAAPSVWWQWVLVVPCLYGFYILTSYLSWKKEKASPGAMDNLSGVGIAMQLAKYFKDNPELIPDNCRIMFAAMGSEEAGLKGAYAYVKEHYGKDDILNNAYVVNIDSIADEEHFEVVKGDLWQTAFFNKDMCRMALEAMDEAGLNPKVIINPIGGCDSTPFHKKNIPTCTIAAQKPEPTNYYHTYNDKSTRFKESTLADGFHALSIMALKICEFEQNKSK